ncbi:MAG: TFIIB-type zinc finger domain-containing protein, partial [Phascolarctobacterium sp.]|nr:TFIIB-type zinc finger domain-containing protein [Candidatus Phascolarctobacterium caballi]
MKKISCEMCGGNDFVKEEGFFVCQNCGVKYSVAEAQKILLEGKVDVTGSQIKIDDTEELENLYILAKRAKDSYDCQNAVNYYNQILLKRPNDWEVCFYQKFFSVADCGARDVIIACQKIKDACYFVFSAWKESGMAEEQKNMACHEITKYILKFSQNSFNKVMNEFSQTSGNYKSSAWENPYKLPDNDKLQNTEYFLE